MPTNTETTPPRETILENLIDKMKVKRTAYEATLETFNHLKELLHELCNDLNDALEERTERHTRLEYRDRGKFEAEIKVGSDILIFSMHSNIFQFDRDHLIWKTSYVQKERDASYCGMISIYNFLADSFRYNRIDDLGYLIGRIFINKDRRFFVEGKRQMTFGYATFGDKSITEDDIKSIIEIAISYAIDFDLLVPPYDAVKEATVQQMNTKIENAKLQTGKRLGFKFNSDDVLASNETDDNF